MIGGSAGTDFSDVQIQKDKSFTDVDSKPTNKAIFYFDEIKIVFNLGYNSHAYTKFFVIKQRGD